MKRKLFLLLTLMAWVLTLALTAAAEVERIGSVNEDDEAVPHWQVVLEEKIYPTVAAVASGAATLYVLMLPAITKMRAAATKVDASAAGFDQAAGGISTVGSKAGESVDAVKKLRAELTSLKAELLAQEQQHHDMLLTGLRMMGMGFSHEAELVKNGAAREIMRMEEQYEEHGKD